MPLRTNSTSKTRPKYLKHTKFFVTGFICILTLMMYFKTLKLYDYYSHEKLTNIKYILQWTSNTTEPFCKMGVGFQNFIKRNCSNQNCFITNNRNYFRDVSMFDAILFHGPEISRDVWILPYRRSPEQKYIFTSIESSHYYPLYTRYNTFFNWTWTYRLDSDISYAYITIKDKAGNIIGPKKDMNWIKVEVMKPIDKKVKRKLSHKSKAAAWFVSNCKSKSKREIIAVDLRSELKKYNLTLDIYGECSNMRCPKRSMETCLKKVEKTYYFYLAFENSFSEDYVTEKLLTGLQHFAVPVVYGQANYTRFMPDGIYLDANKSNASQLAMQMYNIINDKKIYYSYFKWHNHYSYHSPDEAPDSDHYCNLCAKLNDITEYPNFVQWWNH